MVPNPGLANAIVAMGGTLFNSILRVEPKGDYVYKSQLESLVGLLNRASYKLESIEDDVQENETLMQILCGALGLVTLLISILFYMVCRNNKDLEARMTTKIGSSMKTNIFHGGDEEHLHGKAMAVNHQHVNPRPPVLGPGPGLYPGPSKSASNLNFNDEV